MKKTHTTAQGKQISMDSIRLSNEHVIAVGNMKVNAKGEQLGPGGVPESTRRQAVNDYYNLHTPTVGAEKQVPQQRQAANIIADPLPPSSDPLIDEQDAMEVEKTEPKLRGSLADAVAKTVTVNQELLKTPKQQAKDKGPSRI
jgi:hypothetical protein